MKKENLRYFAFFYVVKTDDYDAVGNLFFRDVDYFPSKDSVRKKAAEGESNFTADNVMITGWQEMTKEDFEDFMKVN